MPAAPCRLSLRRWPGRSTRRSVVGGAKVSTKIELPGKPHRQAQALVIGGAMADTFLHAQGLGVGKSLVERDMADRAPHGG